MQAFKMEVTTILVSKYDIKLFQLGKFYGGHIEKTTKLPLKKIKLTLLSWAAELVSEFGKYSNIFGGYNTTGLVRNLAHIRSLVLLMTAKHQHVLERHLPHEWGLSRFYILSTDNESRKLKKISKWQICP